MGEKEGAGSESGEVTAPPINSPLGETPGDPAPSPSPQVAEPVKPSEYEILESPEEGGQILAPGIYVYLGTTGVGKTYKAIADASATHRATAKALLIVDTIGAENFEELEHEPDLESAINATWPDDGSVEIGTAVVWTPGDDGQDFEALLAAVKEAGHIVLLIDEVSSWAGSTALRIALRVWRHAKLTILVTCQNVGTDLGQVLLACNPTLFLFKTTAPRSLEWIEKWHRIPEGVVRELPERHYILRKF